jgi:hypothetical protein
MKCPTGCPWVLNHTAPGWEVCETCGIDRVLRPVGDEGGR